MENIAEIIKKLSDKAAWFDIIEVHGNSTPIFFKNNRIYSIQEKENSGCGIRINIDGKTGFSYTNDSTMIEEAIKRALNLSPYGEIENFSLPLNVDKNFEPYSSSIEHYNIQHEIDKGEQALSSILSKYPKANIDVSISRSTGSTKIMNSNGINACYKNSFYSASISSTYILEDGNKIDVWESKSLLSPAPFDDLSKKIIRKIELASKSAKAGSGKLPVILSPRAFARILGIVISGLNAKAVWKGISPFINKIGKKTFNSSLTIFDDPLVQESPFSFPFDDEGVRAKKKALIENGIIMNYISDLKYAEKLGIEPSGNGSRGYSSIPSPSTSNIIINAGEKKYADIVKNIDKGILIEQFIGLGQSNTLTGDFSANLDLAFLIEKGEITGRVKDCMVSDNLFNLLAGEIILSLEREISGSALTPYVLFPKVNYTE